MRVGVRVRVRVRVGVRVRPHRQVAESIGDVEVLLLHSLHLGLG